MRQRSFYLLAGLLVASCVTMGGCGSGDSPDGLQWSFLKQLGPRKAKLAGEVGYCVGEPKPRIEKVIRSHSGNRVFLTLILGPERPEPEECRDVTLGVFKTVSFQRSLGQLVLLDSSTDPPSRRWPITTPAQ